MAALLVADDQPAVRNLLCGFLRSAGHEVVEAENGLEALVLYRAAPERFDCVVTDLEMPVMDGYELIKMVRETTPLARIVCISGSSDCTPPEGVAFLRKPFEPHDVREVVGRILRDL